VNSLAAEAQRCAAQVGMIFLSSSPQLWLEQIELMDRKYRRQYSLSGFLFLLAVAFYPHNKVRAQDETRTIRNHFVFYPAFRFCNPAEVKGFGLGKQPLEVMLAQVYVESRSDKVIAAVKLGWKVYVTEAGVRIATTRCEAPATPEALLSGGTDFIELEALPPKETTIIGTNPLPVLNPGKRTIYVARPFVTVDDVKSVVEIQKSESKMYVVLLYVSAIRFADGAQWVMQNPIGKP